MKLRHLFAVLLAAVSIVWSQSAVPPSSPPIAAVRPVTDDYFGTKVVDPYRYMENLKDPEVQAWFAGQNDYARAVLAGIPGRAQLLARIQELDKSVPQVGAFRLPGDLYLIIKRLPTDDVARLYMRSGLNGQDRLLVDPEKVKLTAANQSKGKNAVFGSAVSDDGRYLVAGIIPGGSETNAELHVVEIASGRETGDVISPRRWLRKPGNLTGCRITGASCMVACRTCRPAHPPLRKGRSSAHICTSLERTPKRTRRCSATAWSGRLMLTQV